MGRFATGATVITSVDQHGEQFGLIIPQYIGR